MHFFFCWLHFLIWDSISHDTITSILFPSYKSWHKSPVLEILKEWLFFSPVHISFSLSLASKMWSFMELGGICGFCERYWYLRHLKMTGPGLHTLYTCIPFNLSLFCPENLTFHSAQFPFLSLSIYELFKERLRRWACSYPRWQLHPWFGWFSFLQEPHILPALYNRGQEVASN